MGGKIRQLVEGTDDPAFAIDITGSISAWNSAAQELFGFTSEEAIGRPCHEIIQGTDDGGLTCNARCAVQQALEANRALRNFDLQVETKSGRLWCNISILIVTDLRSRSRHALHIVHPREMRKRLELLVRDFLITQTELSAEAAMHLLSSARMAGSIKLTPRETQILRLLARGSSSKSIANVLSISEKTVNNHISRILGKLQAHSRLEAVRRAEAGGLL